MYKKAEASFWTAEELDLAHDYKVSSRLTKRNLATERTLSNGRSKVVGRPLITFFVSFGIFFHDLQIYRIGKN